MNKWKSSLVLFITIFVLYAVYMWFVQENRDVARVLLESVVFSAVLTVLSTGLDAVKGKFLKK